MFFWTRDRCEYKIYRPIPSFHFNNLIIRNKCSYFFVFLHIPIFSFQYLMKWNISVKYLMKCEGSSRDIVKTWHVKYLYQPYISYKMNNIGSLLRNRPHIWSTFFFKSLIPKTRLYIFRKSTFFTCAKLKSEYSFKSSLQTLNISLITVHCTIYLMRLENTSPPECRKTFLQHTYKSKDEKTTLML